MLNVFNKVKIDNLVSGLPFFVSLSWSTNNSKTSLISSILSLTLLDDKASISAFKVSEKYAISPYSSIKANMPFSGSLSSLKCTLYLYSIAAATDNIPALRADIPGLNFLSYTLADPTLRYLESAVLYKWCILPSTTWLIVL